MVRSKPPPDLLIKSYPELHFPNTWLLSSFSAYSQDWSRTRRVKNSSVTQIHTVIKMKLWRTDKRHNCYQPQLHKCNHASRNLQLHMRGSWKRGLTLILRRSRTGTVWFYTSTSNKRAARPKLYTNSLTRDLKRMYSRLTRVRISINL